MTYAARVDEHGLLTLPQELCEHLGLTANTQVELEESDNMIRLHPATGHNAEAQRVEQKLKETAQYVGLQRDQFLTEGWTSVEEYIADMRGR